MIFLRPMDAQNFTQVTAPDLDGDHITDYADAGDMLGNVWRFDLTSDDPADWAVRSTPVDLGRRPGLPLAAPRGVRQGQQEFLHPDAHRQWNPLHGGCNPHRPAVAGCAVPYLHDHAGGPARQPQ